jgi:hypothetical protein
MMKPPDAIASNARRSPDLDSCGVVTGHIALCVSSGDECRVNSMPRYFVPRRSELFERRNRVVFVVIGESIGHEIEPWTL